MRIFVVGTGRCGTATFYHACRHITNYTKGYESEARHKVAHFDYPDNHIEIGAQLWMSLGAIRQQAIRQVGGTGNYLFVHLTRNKEDCVRSLAHNSGTEIQNFVRHWRQCYYLSNKQAAELFYDLVNMNIDLILQQYNFVHIKLDYIQNDWPVFWQRIGAEGDLNASLQIWKRKYNSTQKRGRDVFV